MKRRLITFPLLLIFLGILILILDLKLTRGFYLSTVAPEPIFDVYSENNLSLFYTIRRMENGNYELEFKNNSITPKQFYLYEWETFFKLSDSILFYYASRDKINFNGRVKEDYYGFDCGSGLRTVSINPFERFKVEKNP